MPTPPIKLKKFYYKLRKREQTIKPLILLLAASASTYLIARNIFSKTLIFGDTPWVNINSPEIIGQYIFNIRTPAAYGDNIPKPQGYIFLYLFAKLASAFQNMALYNFLLHVSLPTSFITFYYCLKKYCRSMWTRIFGATLYLVNPITIAYFAAGQLMWIFVFLPLSIYYFLDLLELQKLQNTFKAALFASLTLWTLPQMAFILMLGFATLALSYVLTEKNRRVYLKKLFLQVLIYTLLIFLCLAPYIYSTLLSIQSSLFNISGNIILDFQYTYQEATIPNLLRLAGNGGSPQIKFDYNSSTNLNNEFGYIIPLLAFASILWIRDSDRRQRIIATLTLLCFTTLSTVFLRFACNSELKWFITDVFLVWTLRNPFKIQILMLAAVVPLFTFSTENLSISTIKFLQQKNFKSAAITAILIFLAVSHIYFYNAFAFNGYMGIDKYPGMSQVVVDETLSRIVNDSFSWPDGGSFRGIIFPFDHKTELYVEYSNMFLYPSRLGQSSNISDMIGNALNEGVNFENLLRLFGIKYVYVNNMWEDTAFHIIQPKSLEAIPAMLNGTDKMVVKDGYSKLTLENALPTVYVSQYPIFYSNLETVNLLATSIFQKMPVFLEMENLGFDVKGEGGNLFKTFYYGLNIPYPNNYNLFAVTYFEEGFETPLYWRLDAGDLKEKAIIEGQNPIKNVALLQLQSGMHNLSITVNNVVDFADLDFSFLDYGGGAYCFDTSFLEVKGGTLVGLKEFKNFDLTLKFRAANFGEANWHGPHVHFAITDDSYFSVIFHGNGYVELAKRCGGIHHSFLVLKQANLDFKNWNSLRLVKVFDTVYLYLNGRYMFSFKDPLLNNAGKIGLGSYYLSKTIFSEVVVTPNVLRGVWLIPEGNGQACSAEVVGAAPGHYSLKINCSEGSWLFLFVGENCDPFWSAFVDGEFVENHFRANGYGNCWAFNVSGGLANVQISYQPNILYKYLLSTSLAVETLLIVIAYFPNKTLKTRLYQTQKPKVTED